MTETITQGDFIKLLQDIGPHSWWVYSAMTALAVDGQCKVTQEELASQLGVSESSIRRYITKLSRYQVAGKRLVQAAREFDSNVYHLIDLKVLPGPATSKKEVIQRRATATEEVWRYWFDKYQERYGVKYKPSNWGKDKGCMKRLVERYEGNVEFLKQIIDVVMRMYDQRWKTKQFLRPTIGQLSSWLATQAEPFALKSAEPEPDPKIEVLDDGADLMELIDRKWGV